MYNHLYAYLTYYKLLLDEQSGFRENRSCESTLLKLTDYFLNNIDKGNLCGMVLVDLRKAFGLVDHELILLKQDLYGCRENKLAWFRSNLGERYQCMKYDSVLSDPLPVNVDSNLSWNVHVTKLCSKLCSRMYLFNQVKQLMPLHARKFILQGCCNR